MDKQTKKEFLQRAENLEEECKLILSDVTSLMHGDVVARRSERILDAFQKLLVLGHDDHCQHNHSVQLVVVPVSEVKGMRLPVPENLKDKFKLRLLMDGRHGYVMTVTGEEMVIDGDIFAPSVMPPRPTSFNEIVRNGFTPQQLIEGALKVLHQTIARNIANIPPASA
jgi:hypothetical protein